MFLLYSDILSHFRLILSIILVYTFVVILWRSFFKFYFLRLWNFFLVRYQRGVLKCHVLIVYCWYFGKNIRFYVKIIFLYFYGKHKQSSFNYNYIDSYITLYLLYYHYYYKNNKCVVNKVDLRRKKKIFRNLIWTKLERHRFW